MDPILQQLFAADPTLLDQVSAPPPSVTRPPDPLPAPLPAPAAQTPFAPEASAPVPAPGIPGAQSGSAGVSASRKAWSPDQAAAIEGFSGTQERKAEAKDLGGRIAQDDAQYRADTEALRQRGQAAIATQGDLAARKAADEAEAGRKQAAEEMKVAADLQSFTDAAWTRVAQSQADFQAQLAAQRGMRIDPQQWYSDRSEGQKVRDALSSGIAMYWMASGKPAMAEVGKHILGNFDKQVERNIDSQVQNLKNQQEVSQGFMQAWQMASSNAVNEQEAKHRVHAMLLQAHKDQLTADIGAKYDSDQARAAAEMASVELDRKIQEDLQKATKERQQAELQLAGMKSQEYQTRLRVAQDDRQLAVRKEELAAAKKAAAKPYDDSLVVADPETGERRYKAIDADSKKRILEASVASQQFQEVMEELDTAIRNTNGRSIGRATSLSMLMDSEDRVVGGLAHRAAMMYAKALDPNSKISDKDYIQTIAHGVPIAGVLDRSTTEDARNAIRSVAIKGTNSAFRSLTTDFDPAELAAHGLPTHGAQKAVQEGANAQANAKPPVTTETDDAASIFKQPKARDIDWVKPTEADNQWLIYATEGGKLDGKPARAKSVIGPSGYSPRLRQPGWAEALSTLDAKASDPKVPEAERVQARTKLMQIKALDEADNVDAAYFAKWLLEN